MKNFIISVYEGFLTFLAWVILLGCIFIGYYWGSNMGYTNQAVVGVIAGIITGVLIDIIFLGFLFQISSMRKDIADLKAKYAPEISIQKEKKSKKENEGISL